MDDRTAFIAGAILDIQSTIRAIDVKIGAILVGLLAPFSSFGRVWAHFMKVCSTDPTQLGILLTTTFFMTWLLSIASLVRAISAIDNPAKHIINSGNFKGSLYDGGIYKFDTSDAFLNRSKIKSTKDIATFASEAPDTKEEINNELAFEQLKLIYIRDIKLVRLNTGINLAAIWLTIGIVSFLFSKFS